MWLGIGRGEIPSALGRNVTGKTALLETLIRLADRSTGLSAPGHCDVGIPISGAMDRSTPRAANMFVGNGERLAVPAAPFFARAGRRGGREASPASVRRRPTFVKPRLVASCTEFTAARAIPC